MKMRVRAHRDDDLKPSLVEIWKGKKKVTVDYKYSPKGDVFDFTITGRRDLLPSVPELLQIVDAKRLDRIGTIELIDLITQITNIKNVESIDLIDLITKISEITTVKNIDTIKTIENLYLANLPLFQNSSFEVADPSDSKKAVGWLLNNAERTDASPFKGSYHIESTSAVISSISQELEIPIECKYITELSIQAADMGGSGNLIQVYAHYSDGTADNHTFAGDLSFWYQYCDMTPFLDTTKKLIAVYVFLKDLDVYVDSLVCTADQPTVIADTIGNLPIDLKANSIGNLPIDITANSLGNLPVDITAQTLGNLGIDIAAQSIGNIGIDMKAQSVDMNVKTSGGANIVIDRLTQAAYTERRSTISNDNNVTTPTAPPSNLTATAYKGKFFPRGCRGHLNWLKIYCKRTGTGKLTLAYSPHMGLGESGTVEITPDAAWNWKDVTVKQFWNYDSLFIWVKSCDADVSYGYDETSPYDGISSADSGVTWSYENRRYFLRAIISGETVGDLPVSGTVNTVEIPHESQEYLYGVNNNLPLVETTLEEVWGAGYAEYIELWVSANTDSHKTDMYVYCDEVLTFHRQFSELNGRGYIASTPKISLLSYAVDGFCDVMLSLKFGFLQHLKIVMKSITTGGQNVGVEGMVNLIK